MGNQARGFTLLECLIAMVVASAIVCVAVPSYMNAAASARVASLQTTLFEHLTLAMRHSIVTSTSVVMCISPDGEQCGSGTSWSEGWIAFADIDGDRDRGPYDPLIQKNGYLTGGLQMSGSAGRAKLVFKANGGNPGSNTTFTLCDLAGRARARSVMLANNGRLRKALASPEAESKCRTR